MIFGAPSKFVDLNQFVSAEYHLLRMIFSRDCFCKTIISIKSISSSLLVLLWSAPELSMARLMPLLLTSLWGWHCQHSSGGASEKHLGGAGRSSASPGYLWPSGIPSLLSIFWTELLTPSQTTQTFSWSRMMDPGFLLNLVPTDFLGLSLYVWLIFTLVLSNLTQFPPSCIYSLWQTPESIRHQR